MFGFLLVLLILVGLFLMVVVLLQSGKGGGLAAVGGGAGTDTFLGGRQAATLLTRATWVSGGLFLFLSLVLAVMSSRRQQPESILRDEFPQAVQPQPVLPGVQSSESTAVPQGEGAAQEPAAVQPQTPESR